MDGLYISLLSIIAYLFFLELIPFFVYGWFISKKTKLLYSGVEKSDYRLNRYDDTILMFKNKQHISRHSSIFWKYHIYNLGVVPRWSSLHKEIQRYYNIASEKNN
jgi:hypothetical protein